MAADSRFLSLPRELRNIIYSYLVPVGGCVIDHPRPKPRRGGPLSRITAILCVSRQVNDEAKDVLYRSKTSPPLTIHLGNLNKASTHPACDSFEAILPRTPILEAREIRVEMEIFSETVVEDLPRPKWHLSDEFPRHEKEYLTCCLLSEVIHMVSILRERDELPILSINFVLYPWLDILFDTMETVRQLLKPVAQLHGMPGGVKATAEYDHILRLAIDPSDITRLRNETAGPRPHLPMAEHHLRLLDAHFQYCKARDAYDALSPWEVAREIRTASAEELKLEKNVRKLRLRRRRLARAHFPSVPRRLGMSIDQMEEIFSL